MVNKVDRVLDFAFSTGWWDSNVQSRSQEFIPKVGRSPEKSFSWSGSWPNQRARGLPWAELGICLHDPSGGQSQQPEPLTETLLCTGLQVGCFFMYYLNHTHSDRFIINDAHLSENEIKGPNMRAACPDNYRILLPPTPTPT